MDGVPDGGIVMAYNSALQSGTSKRLSGSIDAVAAAVTNKTMEVATQAMQQQYSRFLEAFA